MPNLPPTTRDDDHILWRAWIAASCFGLAIWIVVGAAAYSWWSF